MRGMMKLSVLAMLAFWSGCSKDDSSDKGEPLSPDTTASGSWTVVGDSNFWPGEISERSLFVYQGTPWLAFSTPGMRVIVMKYEGSAWSQVGPDVSALGDFPSLYVEDGVPYVAFLDSAARVRVRKYDNGGWVIVGDGALEDTIARVVRLDFDNGVPYVAYLTNLGTNRLTVEKLENDAWVPVGNESFFRGSADIMAFDVNNGVPLVVFRQLISGDPNVAVMAMKYDGANWVSLMDTTDIYGEPGGEGALVVDGVPYIAYSDWDSGFVNVKRYTGSAWESVGQADFGKGWFPCLKSSGNDLFILYEDEADSNKATLMKFSGASWTPVGESGFTPQVRQYMSLFVETGVPYMVFSDRRLKGPTVMKYE